MNPQCQDAGNINRSQRRFIFSNLTTHDKIVNLDSGQSWGLKGKRRIQTLTCLQGSVWVTQEGDISDYVLHAGDAFVVTLPGLIFVRALEPASVGQSESLKAVPYN